MILERFYEEGLAQASYLVGCEATREALVVDPHRDADVYLEAAARRGLRIAHVTETHIHADFVSGTRELAARTGATVYLSDEGGDAWRYGFADARTVRLRDGDAFRVGRVRVEAVHTPGHTPEHLAFLVTDTAAADRPLGAFTGDFLFVGDVGRPDLLERAAKIAGTAESAARTLYRSLQRFKALPDYLQIWPGHGAGSACGKSLGALPQSTLGYERLTNWAFAHDDEDAFVRDVLAGQPDPPPYFAVMKRVNRDGPQVLGGPPRAPRLPDARCAELVEAGALVVDVRPAPAYARAHVPGTWNLPFDRSFLAWAGWLLPYDRELYLIVPDDGGPDPAAPVLRALALIGLDRVAGAFGEGAVRAWAAAGRPVGTAETIAADALAAALRSGAVRVLDVREPAEWAAGHLPGVPNLPLGRLADRIDELPRDRPVVVHCQTGSRSAIAASLLRARGLPRVLDLAGGFEAWRAAGYPVEGAPEGAAATG